MKQSLLLNIPAHLRFCFHHQTGAIYSHKLNDRHVFGVRGEAAALGGNSFGNREKCKFSTESDHHCQSLREQSRGEAWTRLRMRESPREGGSEELGSLSKPRGSWRLRRLEERTAICIQELASAQDRGNQAQQRTTGPEDRLKSDEGLKKSISWRWSRGWQHQHTPSWWCYWWTRWWVLAWQDLMQ